MVTGQNGGAHKRNFQIIYISISYFSFDFVAIFIKVCGSSISFIPGTFFTNAPFPLIIQNSKYKTATLQLFCHFRNYGHHV